MSDDLKQNLANYKAQLQQVEAALTSDTQNEDLLKLKNDLQEVIVLTEELVANQDAAPAPSSSTDGATASASGEKRVISSSSLPARAWQIGDKCLAIYSDDQAYYEATIDEILDDGTCTVTFDGYGNTDITPVQRFFYSVLGDCCRLLPLGGKRKFAEGGRALLIDLYLGLLMFWQSHSKQI